MINILPTIGIYIVNGNVNIIVTSYDTMNGIFIFMFINISIVIILAISIVVLTVTIIINTNATITVIIGVCLLFCSYYL